MLEMDVINLKFYAICFLDSLTLGLYLPILSSHITSLGGNHTILGILASLYAFVRLFAGSLIYTWTNRFGRKVTLLLSLLINYLLYFPFGTTQEYATIILLRLIVAFCNQTNNICNSFIAEVNDKDRLSSIYSVTNVVSVAGLVVGPIIGGAIFDEKNGFYYISRLSTAFLFIALGTATTLPASTIPTDKTLSFSKKIIEDLKRKFGKLAILKFSKDWDFVILKFLHSVSATTFFMKFSMMLKLHFQLPSTVIGCTYAYQGSLTFLAPFLTAFMNWNSVLFVLVYPMIVSHSFLNTAWKKMGKERSSDGYSIEGADDSVGEVASIVIPVIFGVVCDLYGLKAFKAFVIVPILLNIFISIIGIPKKITPRAKSN
ncbi:hypothetical protein FQR65_LT06811 [Abscondita terminalis]|nr:hypothetical protein FQR65_LT06811 [Abscondita terminalis]